MKNINLIGILFNELIETEEVSEDYERIVGEANENLVKRLKQNRKRNFEVEDLINEARDKESRFYFELGFKCAMQLRNIGEELMQNE